MDRSCTPPRNPAAVPAERHGGIRSDDEVGHDDGRGSLMPLTSTDLHSPFEQPAPASPSSSSAVLLLSCSDSAEPSTFAGAQRRRRASGALASVLQDDAQRSPEGYACGVHLPTSPSPSPRLTRQRLNALGGDTGNANSIRSEENELGERKRRGRCEPHPHTQRHNRVVNWLGATLSPNAEDVGPGNTPDHEVAADAPVHTVVGMKDEVAVTNPHTMPRVPTPRLPWCGSVDASTPVRCTLPTQRPHSLSPAVRRLHRRHRDPANRGRRFTATTSSRSSSSSSSIQHHRVVAHTAPVYRGHKPDPPLPSQRTALTTAQARPPRVSLGRPSPFASFLPDASHAADSVNEITALTTTHADSPIPLREDSREGEHHRSCLAAHHNPTSVIDVRVCTLSGITFRVRVDRRLPLPVLVNRVAVYLHVDPAQVQLKYAKTGALFDGAATTGTAARLCDLPSLAPADVFLVLLRVPPRRSGNSGASVVPAGLHRGSSEAPDRQPARAASTVTAALTREVRPASSATSSPYRSLRRLESPPPLEGGARQTP